MTQPDQLKQYKVDEQEAASGPNYTDHREMDIRRIWLARKHGYEEPEWVPVKSSKKGEVRATGRPSVVTAEQLAYILSSKENATIIAAKLGLSRDVVLFYQSDKHCVA